MAKLIIQIPCLNEAEQLPISLAALPREVPGFDDVEWLIIDDGSTDDTTKVARSLGVDHVVTLTTTTGLAYPFEHRPGAALQRGAAANGNTSDRTERRAGK